MLTLKFKCSFNGEVLTEEERNYNFNTFSEFCEQWKSCDGKGFDVEIEGYKVTATSAGGKVYEYTLEMNEHFFVVYWETVTNAGYTREYSKQFATEEEGRKFAQMKKSSKKTNYVRFSEEEKKDTPQCLYLRIIRMNIAI